MKKFELIEALGVKVWGHHSNVAGKFAYDHWVRADDIQQALATQQAGKDANGCVGKPIIVYGMKIDDLTGAFSWTEDQEDFHTHQAELFNPQPIKRDTAESLLRELCDRCDGNDAMIPRDVYDRARKLLGGKP